MGSEQSTDQNEQKKDETDIPPQYLCALTQKIMTNPMMALTTGKVYDHTSIQKWIESGQNVDPTNGIPLCIEESKDAAFEFREDLKAKIDEYLTQNPDHKQLQSTKDIDWDKLFKTKLQHIIYLRKEYKRAQRQLLKSSQLLFGTQRITPGQNDEDLKFNHPEDKLDFHDLPLRSDIPIVTFMGPSRSGKSTLLNDIIGNPTAFKVSDSPNIQCTKGAWIACYQSINGQHNFQSITEDDEGHNAPDFDGDEEKFAVTKTKGGDQLKNKEYPKEIVAQLEQFGYSRKQILMAMESVDEKKRRDINAIIDVINTEDEISKNDEIKHDLDNLDFDGNEHEHSKSESDLLWDQDRMTAGFMNDIRQFYMIDMEGLSHDITPFTKKLFYACYAMSNVIIWNDKQIGSDEFKKFMKDLSKEMKIISKSERKPCLLYLQRDAGYHTDFGEYYTLDQYMKNHDSFQWLRDMKIFDSIHGFQLPPRPNFAIEIESASTPTSGFQPKTVMGFDAETLSKLVEFVLNLTFLSKRFVENGYDMRQQVARINEKNNISLGLELVFANEVLRGLVMDDGVRDNGNLRRSQIVQYAERNKWDKDLVEKQFDMADNGLLKGLLAQGLIEDEFRNELIKNKDDVIEAIKEKNTDTIIKIALIVTSPITVPIAIIVGLASAVVIGPWLAGSAIYDKWIKDEEDGKNVDNKKAE